MGAATAADYTWLEDHWLREAFCFTVVHGLDEAEVLRRLGGERSRPRTLAAAQAAELSYSFQAGDPQLVLATTAGPLQPCRGRRAPGPVRALFPQRHWGARPGLLLPQMRAVGLDPDWDEPPYGEIDAAALALAERVTGVHLDPGLLDRPMLAAEAMAAAVAGRARPVDDHSPLGWRIRTWDAEVRVAGQVANDSSVSLEAQRREASLPRGRAGRRPAPQGPVPLAGPQPGRAAAALAGRGGRPGRPVRRLPHRLYATLEQLRHLPGDLWPGLRAEALDRLRHPGPPAARR